MSSFCILKLCSTSPSYWMGTSNYSIFLLNSTLICYNPFVRFIHSSCSAMARNFLRRPVFSFGCNLTFSDMATVAVQGCLLHHSILSMMLTITGCFRAYNPFLFIIFWAWSWSSSRSGVSFSMPDRILLAIHVYPFIII